MHGSTTIRMPARLAGALAAIVLAIVASMAFAAPAGAGTVEDEARLFQLHNEARAQAGLAAFQYDSAATGVARSWAQELARSGSLRHNPNLAAHVDAYVTRSWTRIGENVGYSTTVDQVHTAYMNSSGHRANILGDFNRAGVGAARSADGRLWTTVVFIKGPSLAPTAAYTTQRCAARTDGATATNNAVARLYRAYFLRDADQAGLDYWVPKYRSGELCLGDISNYFAGSNEFRARYGSLDVPHFVRLVYVNVLQREPDAAGYNYWAEHLTYRGMSRGQMMIGFSESNEFRARTGLA